MTQYKLPEKIATMTVHHVYGLTKAGEYATIDDYMKEKGFALTGDLLAQDFEHGEIKQAVNDGKIEFAHWPEEKQVTDLYWTKDRATLERLEELAEKAVQFCYGKTPDEPVGGNFATVGAEMGNQQLALVGLIYAREQGKLREVPELDQGAGPLYIAKGSFADKIFEMLLK